MSETKEFATVDVLSALTGVMVTERKLEGVKEVLDFVTGSDLQIWNLPRASDFARAERLQEDSIFVETMKESDDVTPENVEDYIPKWVARHGETMTVARLKDDFNMLTMVEEMAYMHRQPWSKHNKDNES